MRSYQLNFSMLLRVAVYLMGLALLSLGIVLSKKSNLGIAPVSTIPLVAEKLLPLTFGQVTMLFYLINIAVQCILCPQRGGYVKILLQIPVSFVCSLVLDFFQQVIPLEGTTPGHQLLLLILSVPLIAFGMVLVVHMELMPNPPDGTVRIISLRTGKELGTVKNIYDICCVLVSSVLSLAVFRRLYGFGVATVVTALLVGRFVRVFSRAGNWLQRQLVT